MTMFLYKPHVVGPEGAVTSPDVIVDHALIDGARLPLAQLTMAAWLQSAEEETARAAYAVMALGGGALLAPAVVLSGDTVSIARAAWRLNNLDGRIGQVTLNGQPLPKIGLPAGMITAAGGKGDVLPRGFLLIQTSDHSSWNATLIDAAVDRKLDHKLDISDNRSFCSAYERDDDFFSILLVRDGLHLMPDRPLSARFLSNGHMSPVPPSPSTEIL